MGFNSRVTLAYGFGTTILRKMQKSKKTAEIRTENVSMRQLPAKVPDESTPNFKFW